MSDIGLRRAVSQVMDVACGIHVKCGV